MNALLFMITDPYSDIMGASKKLKEKAIKEYRDARKMPRKKKKQAKKSAILLYNIACWNPLEI